MSRWFSRISLGLLIFSSGLSARADTKPSTSLALTPAGFLTTQISAKGMDLWMDVDTGNDVTILDPEIATKLGLTLKEKTNVYGVEGTFKARMSELALEAPGYKSDPLPCLVFSHANLARHGKGDVTKGILGYDFLSKAGAIIDFNDLSIRFGSDTPLPADTSDCLVEIPFNYLPRWGITVPARINGKDVVALIDTGTVQTVVFSDIALPSAYGRPKDEKGNSYTFAEKIEFTDRRLGTLSFEKLFIILHDKQRKGVDPLADGLPKAYIGLDILYPSRAKIDFRRNVICLRKTVGK